MPTSVESLDASGYLNGRYTEEGMDEDGFFTCAVSVQHKVSYLFLLIQLFIFYKLNEC